MAQRPGVHRVFKDDSLSLTIDMRVLAPADSMLDLILNELMFTYIDLTDGVRKKWK